MLEQHDRMRSVQTKESNQFCEESLQAQDPAIVGGSLIGQARSSGHAF